MEDYLEINFRIKPKNINRLLVTSVINACLNVGSKYYETDGFSIAPLYSKEYKGSLEMAINTLSKKEGKIHLKHEDFADYSITFHPQKSDKLKLGNLSIYFSASNLKPEDKGPKNAQKLINIAKAIWNALEEKPIYGFGDNEDEVLYPSSESGSGEGWCLTDESIIALDVPINKFWLNFYGKDMIEKYGRKRLEEKAYRVEELDDGLLVVTSIVPIAYQISFGWGAYKDKI